MAKKLYLFVLGRDPELARIEIESVLERFNVEFRVMGGSDNVQVVEMASFNPEWIEEFGGIIKVAEVISNSSKPEVIETELSKKELYEGASNKITYFFDTYETDIDDFVEEYLKSYFKSIRVKANIKKESYPTRLIKKNTLTEGLEIVVFRNYVGRTITVSNPLSLKERDLGRPRTDYLKTISLRLAKILINLSCVKKGELLVDPFCGSGGILQEAVLKGINVLGVDADRNAIEESRLNMEWLEKRYKFSGTWKVVKGDATKLTDSVRSCDGIATEPYLGPYIRKMFDMFQAKSMIADLRGMYNDVLKESSKIVKKGGKITIIVPRFKTKEGKNVAMGFSEVASSNGFRVIHGPILYAYKESKLIREIYVIVRE